MNENIIIIELDPKAKVAHDVVEGGTLDEWKETARMVAALPAMPHWNLALIAGPVGCLVDFLELPSCGMNYSGATSIGKTTAQMLACSWWTTTLPRDGSSMYSANTTVNAFELMATRSNSSIVCIDELALKTCVAAVCWVHHKLSCLVSAGYKMGSAEVQRSSLIEHFCCAAHGVSGLKTAAIIILAVTQPLPLKNGNEIK